ncbi:hypothetical protein EXIGLDRAFT_729534 [Exidia glandulosa HHB12029]|uniref:Uncharacterized protein n=1 Tax=Exidia glandulosa HHB12029 TaxID=1314781 RepID=A0A165CJ23_EXIGL|nr:hypothetical protein EXIGLDRAFT_729534 [Exidia glandulosa HHB12029]
MATLIPGAAHRVPPEVLQYIFGLSVTGSVENVDPAPASERSSRNQVLLNAAQVCRAWARSAQYLLFRDIFVGSRTVISQYRKIVETSSIHALLDALESLPNTNHVQSAHFEVGHGKIHQSPADTVLAPRYEGYNGRDSWDQPWVFLRWTMPALLLRFLSLCTNLQHLGLTFADHYCDCVHRGHVDADDYPNFPVMDSLRSLSFTCKFSGSLYESAQFSGPPVRLIVEMLARAPLLERLHIDTRTSFRPDAAKLQPLHMPRLRDLRIGGSIPPFLLRAKLPSLESFMWRNQSSESSQLDFLPSTLRSLSLAGDSLQMVPYIRRFPALRHLLVDSSDLQVEQSFRTVSWRNHAAGAKSDYIQQIVENLPRNLHTFTLVESYYVRVLDRASICRILAHAIRVAAATRGLPRTFKVLSIPGPLPPHFWNHQWAASMPIYECSGFTAVREALTSRGVEVVTGETEDPFSNMFLMPGVAM